jgi:hypothetical protein
LPDVRDETQLRPDGDSKQDVKHICVLLCDKKNGAEDDLARRILAESELADADGDDGAALGSLGPDALHSVRPRRDPDIVLTRKAAVDHSDVSTAIDFDDARCNVNGTDRHVVMA